MSTSTMHHHLTAATCPSIAAALVVRAKTDTGLTVISISGEIDASNADDVSGQVRELAYDCGAAIVDLADMPARREVRTVVGAS
jgi:hypothetical protein